MVIGLIRYKPTLRTIGHHFVGIAQMIHDIGLWGHFCHFCIGYSLIWIDATHSPQPAFGANEGTRCMSALLVYWY